MPGLDGLPSAPQALHAEIPSLQPAGGTAPLPTPSASGAPPRGAERAAKKARRFCHSPEPEEATRPPAGASTVGTHALRRGCPAGTEPGRSDVIYALLDLGASGEILVEGDEGEGRPFDRGKHHAF